ncbi:MAG: SPOR domain-containing protein [Candidatus Marinimicrobia bacterium]|nr:SPOR domain-containing protein [Candidatus Neomarinimicrobiota bacterium]
MTNNVILKRAIGCLLLISILVNCDMWNSRFGREEVKLGEYITLQVEETEEVHQAAWTFIQLPDSSKLDGFLPSDTLDIVSFQPDVPGNYDVKLTVAMNGDIEENRYFFEATMSEDNNLVVGEIPQHLFEASLSQEPTSVGSTQVNVSDDGLARQYLAKVVSPNQTKSTPAKKSSQKSNKSVKSVKAVTPPSRGNLIPLAAKTFTIQVSAWPSLDDAQAASKELQGNYGIDSYIQRAFFKDTDEIYYRLRVGNFKESTAAEAYAKVIQDMTSLPVWVDYVRQEM